MLAHDLNREIDERSQNKVELVVDITLHGENNFFTGCAHKITSGGIFIATHQPQPIGTTVLLTLTLPDAPRAIQAKGEVRWVRPYKEDNDAPAGIGVKFVALDVEGVAAIERFMTQRAPIFYE